MAWHVGGPIDAQEKEIGESESFTLEGADRNRVACFDLPARILENAPAVRARFGQ